MKTELVFAFFVILTLLIVSFNPTEKEQTKDNISSCQSTNLNKECLIPELSFSQNKFVSKLIFLRLVNSDLFESTNTCKVKLSVTTLKLYQVKTFNRIPGKQKPFRQKLHYTSEKEDNSHLV